MKTASTLGGPKMSGSQKVVAQDSGGGQHGRQPASYADIVSRMQQPQQRRGSTMQQARQASRTYFDYGVKRMQEIGLKGLPDDPAMNNIEFRPGSNLTQLKPAHDENNFKLLTNLLGVEFSPIPCEQAFEETRIHVKFGAAFRKLNLNERNRYVFCRQVREKVVDIVTQDAEIQDDLYGVKQLAQDQGTGRDDAVFEVYFLGTSDKAKQLMRNWTMA